MLDRILYYQVKLLYFRSWEDSLCRSRMPDGSIIFSFFDCIPDFDVMYFDRVYERFGNLKEGNVVIDCGANVGVFTVMAAQKTKGSTIAYEPYPKNYDLLQRNIVVNGLTNVRTFRTAVTSEPEGKIKLFVSDGGVGHSIREISHRFIEVETTNLDRCLQSQPSFDKAFLKLDVEGAELDILKGAKQLLQNQKIGYAAIASYHYKTEATEIAAFLLRECKDKNVFISENSDYVYLI